MKLSKLAMASCIAAALLPARAEPTKFSPPDNAFTVTFPGEPACSQQNIIAFNGPVTVNTCTYADENSQLFYSATFYSGLLAPATIDARKLLRGAIDGAAAASRSRIIENHELTVSGFPAMESLTQEPNGLISISQYVIAKQRLFSLEISGWENRIPSEAVNGFLDSFKVRSNQ
jgi:hypothetical protein